MSENLLMLVGCTDCLKFLIEMDLSSNLNCVDILVINMSAAYNKENFFLQFFLNYQNFSIPFAKFLKFSKTIHPKIYIPVPFP